MDREEAQQVDTAAETPQSPLGQHVPEKGWVLVFHFLSVLILSGSPYAAGEDPEAVSPVPVSSQD